MSATLDYTRLATPPGDGAILIEPAAARWPLLFEQNAEQLRRLSIHVAGRDVREIRRSIRTQMGSADPDQPILAVGHQPGFAHPGVWAKHVVARHISRQLKIRAIDLVVDNDAPTQPDLVVPRTHDGLLSLKTVHFSSGPNGSAYEGRPALGVDQVQSIRRELQTIDGDFFTMSLMPAYLAAYPMEGTVDFVDQHVKARATIDAPFDARLDELRISQHFDGPFAADLLLNAGPFAEAYNQALQEYRRREEVRSPLRPLPDLGRDANRIETALWIYQTLERRRRLWVEHKSDKLRIFADQLLVAELNSTELARDPEAILKTLSPWLIRPRALTLTLWARLLVCDLFVHGIGGAKYDRITDGIFQRYYKCEPPQIACVSATLSLPLPRHSVTLDDLRQSRRDLRDIQFNPQRYLVSPSVDLVAERDRLIKESSNLRELSGDRSVRRRIYLALRELNQRMLEHEPDLISQLTRRVDRVQTQWNSDRIAESREFFYALQPSERLQLLAEKLRAASVLG